MGCIPNNYTFKRKKILRLLMVKLYLFFGKNVAEALPPVPKYRSPKSPMPGITLECSFRPASISEVTIFSLGYCLHTACIPSGACMHHHHPTLKQCVVSTTVLVMHKWA